MPAIAMRATHALGMDFDWFAESDVPAFQSALDHWLRKCRGRRMPSRADLVPAELRMILPLVQLYEVFDGGARYRVRLVGTEVSKMFEADPTGRTSDQAPDHPLVKRVLCVFENLARRPQPVIVRAHRTAIERVGCASIASLYLPLSDNGFDVSMVLAVTVLGGPGQNGGEPTAAPSVAT